MKRGKKLASKSSTWHAKANEKYLAEVACYYENNKGKPWRVALRTTQYWLFWALVGWFLGSIGDILVHYYRFIYQCIIIK